MPSFYLHFVHQNILKIILQHMAGEGTSQSVNATPPHISSDNEDTSSDSASIAVSTHSLLKIFYAV